MTKFIELTKPNGIVFTINADCLQMAQRNADGQAYIIVSVDAGVEEYTIDGTIKESYEELKTKLGAI
ncbi:hypothetical protein [Snodgrassella alvi]|uniref:Uncharacterized protein n=1 Tax=Snodgrassella alvi TaxID=1196083 RepID=A0A2N9XYA1_9NEIS|nr:hypothetical protein [Snodgrassella alvi]PIT55404.1 hypothetical protein BHC49_06435 [Snodgrassella alvi]